MSLASALATGDVAELPNRRQEDWRWTDLRGALRALPPASPAGEAAAIGSGPFDGLTSDQIVFLNGRAQSETVIAVAEAAARTAALRWVSQTSNTAHGGKVRIVVAAGARLVLLESYEGRGEAYVADAVLEFELGEGASVERVVLAEDAADAISVSTATVALAPHARFAQTVLTSGAKRQRLETQVSHPGGGGELRLDGGYLIGGARHADLTTVVAHQGLDGRTEQLTKGAVAGAARGVFQGRIVVAEGADHTDARMGHHALILSDRAEVDATPELEIYADDVACAHGNTVGALDEDALFYIRSRGVPEHEARALLTQAFVGEVVDRIEHEGARDAARAWVASHLEALA